jgi:D-lactate dehydrogenase
MKYTAAFFEAFEEEEKELRKVLPSGHDYYFTWKTIQEGGKDIPPAPVISIRTQSKIPSSWKDSLDGIISRSTGFDHISDYLKETELDIPAAYLPDYAGRAVAEQAMILWSALLRKLPLQENAFRTFYRDKLTGKEIENRTITVLGVGRIGSQIVDIAQGLKMNVTGVDIAPRDISGLKYVSLEEGIRRADVLVCALPLTDITNGMLDYSILREIREGAVFINIARGEIAPSEDLLKLLEEGRLSGIGLDVYDNEKELASILRDDMTLEDYKGKKEYESLSATLALSKRDDVITTPHNAFNTSESVKRKSLHTAQNLEHFLKTGKFLTPFT